MASVLNSGFSRRTVFVAIVAVLFGLTLLYSLRHSNREYSLNQDLPYVRLTYPVSNAAVLSRIELTNGDPLVVLMEGWLFENKSGWSETEKVFPVGYEFHTPYRSFNVRRDFVIATNHSQGGNWKQVMKPAPPSLWEEINRLVAIKEKERKGEVRKANDDE